MRLIQILIPFLDEQMRPREVKPFGHIAQAGKSRLGIWILVLRCRVSAVFLCTSHGWPPLNAPGILGQSHSQESSPHFADKETVSETMHALPRATSSGLKTSSEFYLEGLSSQTASPLAYVMGYWNGSASGPVTGAGAILGVWGEGCGISTRHREESKRSERPSLNFSSWQTFVINLMALLQCVVINKAGY